MFHVISSYFMVNKKSWTLLLSSNLSLVHLPGTAGTMAVPGGMVEFRSTMFCVVRNLSSHVAPSNLKGFNWFPRAFAWTTFFFSIVSGWFQVYLMSWVERYLARVDNSCFCCLHVLPGVLDGSTRRITWLGWIANNSKSPIHSYKVLPDRMTQVSTKPVPGHWP